MRSRGGAGLGLGHRLFGGGLGLNRLHLRRLGIYWLDRFGRSNHLSLFGLVLISRHFGRHRLNLIRLGRFILSCLFGRQPYRLTLLGQLLL